MQSGKEQDYFITAQVPENFHPQIKPIETIRFPDNLQKYFVSSDNKNLLLSELLSKQFNILSVERQKPSLEEIFYKTRSQV